MMPLSPDAVFGLSSSMCMSTNSVSHDPHPIPYTAAPINGFVSSSVVPEVADYSSNSVSCHHLHLCATESTFISFRPPLLSQSVANRLPALIFLP